MSAGPPRPDGDADAAVPVASAWPTAATRLVGVLGWPVRHSLSPQLHNAAFRAQGLDLAYLALPVPPERLPAVVAALADLEAVGANVTVPHKVAVAERCDRLTAEAELIGAVNTLAFGADGLLGDNTDASGLLTTWRDEVGVRGGEAALVVGTGGAARAVAVAAGRLGLRLIVAGRRPAAAEELAALAERAGCPAASACDLTEEAALRAALADVRLVVNATPLGMAGERLPEACHRLSRAHLAHDLIYRPPRTPFLADAAAAGASAHNGLGMLIGQAAASYARWTGQPAPVATMRAAAEAALAGTR